MTVNIKKTYFYGLIDRDVTIPDSVVTHIEASFPAPKVNSKKSINIKELNDGAPLQNVIAGVQSVEKKIAKNNNPFLDIALANSSGSFKAKLFTTDKEVEKQIKLLQESKAIIFNGSVNEYPKGSGNKSVNLSNFDRYELNDDALALLPVLDEDYESIIQETVARLMNMEKKYSNVSYQILKDFWKPYILSPAAKTHHHAYLGGLARHVLEMIVLCDYIHSFENPVTGLELILEVSLKEHLKEMKEAAKPEDGSTPQRYGYLVWGGDTISHLTSMIYKFQTLYNPETYNRDLAKAVTVLHDIGKIVELNHPGVSQEDTLGKLMTYATDLGQFDSTYNTMNSSIVYDEIGELLGHMPIGMLYTHDLFKKYNLGLTAKEIAHIQHLIASHHGKVEWNSTVEPKTAEAVMLHIVDYIGSRYEGYLAKQRH